MHRVAFGPSKAKETDQMQVAAPVKGGARTAVLGCQDLLVHMLEFVGVDRQNGLCACISRDFRTACRSRKISLLIVAHYRAPELHEYEAIKDEQLLHKAARRVALLQVTRELHVRELAEAGQAVEEEGEVRSELHGVIAEAAPLVAGGLVVLWPLGAGLARGAMAAAAAALWFLRKK